MIWALNGKNPGSRDCQDLSPKKTTCEDRKNKRHLLGAQKHNLHLGASQPPWAEQIRQGPAPSGCEPRSTTAAPHPNQGELAQLKQGARRNPTRFHQKGTKQKQGPL